jgi:hypothetical protein
VSLGERESLVGRESLRERARCCSQKFSKVSLLADFSHNTLTCENFEPGGERVGWGSLGTSELNSEATSVLSSGATPLSASAPCIQLQTENKSPRFLVNTVNTLYVYSM